MNWTALVCLLYSDCAAHSLVMIAMHSFWNLVLRFDIYNPTTILQGRPDYGGCEMQDRLESSCYLSLTNHTHCAVRGASCDWRLARVNTVIVIVGKQLSSSAWRESFPGRLTGPKTSQHSGPPRPGEEEISLLFWRLCSQRVQSFLKETSLYLPWFLPIYEWRLMTHDRPEISSKKKVQDFSNCLKLIPVVNFHHHDRHQRDVNY